MADPITPVAETTTSLIGQMVDLLKTGGPYTVAVVCGLYALKKDRDKETNDKRFFEQFVKLATDYASQVAKLEAALKELKEAIQSLGHKR